MFCFTKLVASQSKLMHTIVLRTALKKLQVMRNTRYALILFINLFMLTACSKDDETERCPQTEIISMEINGEVKEFEVNGRGIDLDSDGSGHTLSLWLYTADTQTQEDSYAIIIKLPYKKTGTNIIEMFNYLHFQDGSYQDIDFVQEAFQNTVTVNTNSCFSATFSGHTVVDGNEIIITEGMINYVYDEAFD